MLTIEKMRRLFRILCQYPIVSKIVSYPLSLDDKNQSRYP